MWKKRKCCGGMGLLTWTRDLRESHWVLVIFLKLSPWWACLVGNIGCNMRRAFWICVGNQGLWQQHPYGCQKQSEQGQTQLNSFCWNQCGVVVDQSIYPWNSKEILYYFLFLYLCLFYFVRFMFYIYVSFNQWTQRNFYVIQNLWENKRIMVKVV